MYLQENKDAIDSIYSLERIQSAYRIQISDILSIRVKAVDQELVDLFNPVTEEYENARGEERLYYEGFLVDLHGRIRVPTLGEVKVLGLTVEELREKIERELLENYFTEEANIFVTVKLAGIRYTTIGEINSGSQVIYKERVTIMEAIANAGDIKEFGDRTDVIILRQYPSGQKRHHLDLTSMDALKSPYYYIHPNDLIIVNPLPQKSWGLGTTGFESIRTFTTLITLLISAVLLITR